MKGKKMFQLTDSIIAVENPSFSLKLVENGKTFTTVELQGSLAKGQEYADWSKGLEAIVAEAIHDFLDDGDTYEVKYVGFNPGEFRSTPTCPVFDVYNVDDDSGQEDFLGKVLAENITAEHQEAFFALGDIAQTAEHPDEFDVAFDDLRACIHHLSVLGTNVDGIHHDADEALRGSGWEIVDTGLSGDRQFEFRRVLEPLADRISIVGAELGSEADFGGLCIAFDIAVDGNSVYSTVEWLDDDLDLVADDCHLDVNRGHIDAVRDALGDDWERYNELSASARDGAVYEVDVVIQEKLVDAVAVLKAERSAA